MTKTEYLYGRNFSADMLNQQLNICNYKLERLKLLLDELLSVSMYARDEARIRKVLRAREWNENLKTECEEMLR